MNKKGFEMAISTIIIIVLSIVVLIGLILFLSKGFGWFNSGVKPIANTVGFSAVREACNIACNAENSFVFCCETFSVDNKNLSCTDSRIDVSCPSVLDDCAAILCESTLN